MWPVPIVVCDPLLEKAPQVPVVEWDQKIEAFASNRADQSLTERVRLGIHDVRISYGAQANERPEREPERAEHSPRHNRVLVVGAAAMLLISGSPKVLASHRTCSVP